MVGGARAYNPGWHLSIDIHNMLLVSRVHREGGARAARSRAAGTPATTSPDRTRTWGAKNLVLTLNDAGDGVDLAEKPLPVMPDELKKFFEEK